MNLRFEKKRVRGGVVRIYAEEQFAGEIATCKSGFSLRLPGVCWRQKAPATSGLIALGFARQKDAVAFVMTLEPRWLQYAATTCATNKLAMA